MSTPQSDKTSPVRTLIIVLAAFIVIVLVAVGVIWSRFNHIEAEQRDARTSFDCKVSHIGIEFAYAFDALAAPPVDPKLTPAQQAATPRGVAVGNGGAGAEDLKHPAHLCP